MRYFCQEPGCTRQVISSRQRRCGTCAAAAARKVQRRASRKYQMRRWDEKPKVCHRCGGAAARPTESARYGYRDSAGDFRRFCIACWVLCHCEGCRACSGGGEACVARRALRRSGKLMTSTCAACRDAHRRVVYPARREPRHSMAPSEDTAAHIERVRRIEKAMRAAGYGDLWFNQPWTRVAPIIAAAGITDTFWWDLDTD